MRKLRVVKRKREVKRTNTYKNSHITHTHTFRKLK